MVANEVLKKPLLQVIRLIEDGLLSSNELLSRCYRRIDQIKSLNAFISILPNETNKNALTREHRRNTLLKGIPYAVKDNFSTENIRTTCGSVMLKDYIPTYNSTVVEKLKSSGGIMMGKTNLDEFAMGSGTVDSIFGPVRNPWQYNFNMADHQQDWFISGGSSGGSAVAVATGASFFALGSDTGGSVRIPASLCGVVGLKPTYGSISRHGLISLVNSMDVPGILTRNIDDCAFIYNILSGHDAFDSTTFQNRVKRVAIKEAESVKDLVIGMPKEYHGPELSSDVLDAWCWAADRFSDAGAKVIEVSMPHTQYSIVCYHVLCSGEVASNMARYDGLEYGHRSSGRFTEEMYATSRNEGFNEVVRGRIMAGNYFLLRKNYKDYYKKAQQVRRLITDDFNIVFGRGIDVLLTPTTVSSAPRYKDFCKKSNSFRTAQHDVYTQAANMSGIPAISIPIRLSGDTKMPVSLQLMANNFNEETLLKTAKFLETESCFPQNSFGLQ